ncbi:uncharacterized protein BDZ99DRAFT_573813 [Mytilinidion resinicola]|uniref:Uncharacterized protein n=1 Tax=Mytilinidion resinicola TaxID=574789 RepID=A0A6A6YBZ3_9PEZI|nr:uncharacterized protein BDZ99DRAFT_573813 [Mytilinidion resinicola]KAF2806230.1 hypothetical protein BDZ99DRAFT_573813 [Mytilinidion resinicola]
MRRSMKQSQQPPTLPTSLVLNWLDIAITFLLPIAFSTLETYIIGPLSSNHWALHPLSIFIHLFIISLGLLPFLLTRHLSHKTAARCLFASLVLRLIWATSGFVCVDANIAADLANPLHYYFGAITPNDPDEQHNYSLWNHYIGTASGNASLFLLLNGQLFAYFWMLWERDHTPYKSYFHLKIAPFRSRYTLSSYSAARRALFASPTTYLLFFLLLGRALRASSSLGDFGTLALGIVTVLEKLIAGGGADARAWTVPSLALVVCALQLWLPHFAAGWDGLVCSIYRHENLPHRWFCHCGYEIVARKAAIERVVDEATEEDVGAVVRALGLETVALPTGKEGWGTRAAEIYS